MSAGKVVEEALAMRVLVKEEDEGFVTELSKF
jgi:hypothetical protein